MHGIYRVDIGQLLTCLLGFFVSVEDHLLQGLKRASS